MGAVIIAQARGPQIGSRTRRSRTAAARHAAANTSPSQRRGELRNYPTVRGVSRSIVKRPEAEVAPSEPPLMRDASMAPKCVVWKTIFSSIPIANSGNAAHRKGACRAQAETSSSQPQIGAYYVVVADRTSREGRDTAARGWALVIGTLLAPAARSCTAAPNRSLAVL